MKATYVSREVMDRNWGGGDAPPADPVSGPPPLALNLHSVMDLGNTVFFTFRGRAYGIPPLAWREGEKILAAWLKALEFNGTLERQDLPAYFRVFRELQQLLWKNCRPTGPTRRILRFLHLHRNPFRRATEGEIAELAVFMLGRRTKENGLRPQLHPAHPSPGTS